MISLIFISLAAICNAIMDVLSNHFEQSIFSKMNEKWWNPWLSWRNKYKGNSPVFGRKKWCGVVIPVCFTDAWHLFKQLMIFFLCLSIVTFENICVNDIFGLIAMFLITGFAWWAFFTLFYKIILRK